MIAPRPSTGEDMLAWHVPFLGWQRLPADLSEFEIAHFYTLKPADIRAVRSRSK
jgi:hypothetical protein